MNKFIQFIALGFILVINQQASFWVWILYKVFR